MFCVGPNRKRKSPDKVDALRLAAPPSGATASPSGVLGNPFKSLRLSPIGSGDAAAKKRKNSGGATTSSSSEDMTGFEAAPRAAAVASSGGNPAQRRDALWTGGDARARACQPYKGQLKLSVYINCGHLTVHVMQARHLSSKFKRICDTYVKVSLMPEDPSRPQWKTETIYDTNNPLFDEKFSLELVEGDMRKRLLVTVWCRDAGGKGATEFLGCMSFGVRRICSDSKTISGWYYLLADEVGRRKHLQVLTKKAGFPERLPTVVPKMNQDLKFMDPHLLVLKKVKSGFGFSVAGACPVKVCRVDPGSPANTAGLKPDDCIVRIDGMNVSRSTAESVARNIKRTNEQIVLEVQRPYSVPNMNSSPWKPISVSTPRYQPGAKPAKHTRRFGTRLQELNQNSQLTFKAPLSDCADSEVTMPPFLSCTTPITGNLQQQQQQQQQQYPVVAPIGGQHQHYGGGLRPSDTYPPNQDLYQDTENTPMTTHAGSWRSQENVVPTSSVFQRNVWEAYRQQHYAEDIQHRKDQHRNFYTLDLPAQSTEHIYEKPNFRSSGKRVTFNVQN